MITLGYICNLCRWRIQLPCLDTFMSSSPHVSTMLGLLAPCPRVGDVKFTTEANQVLREQVTEVLSDCSQEQSRCLGLAYP